MTRGLGSVGVLAMFACLSASALAAPGDLDTSYGNGGVAALSPAATTTQSGPVITSDGRAIVAAMAYTSSVDVRNLVLERLTPGGNPDTGWGTNGQVDTGLQSSGVMAATPDGGVVVAAPDGGGGVEVQRYHSDGTLDGSVGDGSGSVNVAPYGRDGGSPTVWGAAVQPDGKVLLALDPSGNSLDVARVDLSGVGGLDSGFGTNGLASADFGTGSVAYAVKLLSNGSILAAGGTGGGTDTPYHGVALARFDSRGQLDTSFGQGGKVDFDASGDGTSNAGYVLTAAADGTATVAGVWSGGTGFIARFTPTGAPDSTFGTGGVNLGIGQASFDPEGLALDGAGRPVVGGSSSTFVGNVDGGGSGTAQWIVDRFTTDGQLDDSFGSSGSTDISPCDATSSSNAYVIGLGLLPDDSRIVVAGDCGDSAASSVAELLTASPLPGGLQLTVDPAADAAGHERTEISNLDPTQVLSATDALQDAPLRNAPLRNAPLRNAPLRNAPLRNAPLRNAALDDPNLAGVELVNLPLINGTWQALLAGTSLANAPLNAVTLQQAMALTPLPSGLANLTLDDIDLEHSPLRNASMAAVLLGKTPLDNLPAPSGGWCSFLTNKALNCGNGVQTSSTDLWELESAGDDLHAYYAQGIDLASPTAIDGSALATIKLTDMDLGNTPFGDVPASEVSSLMACGSSCSGTMADRQNADPDTFSTATLGQLIAKLPLPSLDNITLGEVIAGLLSPDEIPYEQAPLNSLLRAADIRSSDLQAYTASFDADCAQAAGDLRVSVRLPVDARIVPGTSMLTVGSGSPQTIADPSGGSFVVTEGDAVGRGFPTWNLDDACGTLGTVTHMVLSFKAEPGAFLGAKQPAVAAFSGNSSEAAQVDATVDDSHDQPDAPDGAPTISTDSLYTGHIDASGDVDDFNLPAPAAGTRVTITLSHLPADYDLVVYGPSIGPDTAPLRNAPLRNAPLRNAVIGDQSDSNADPGVVPPDSLQDVPLRNAPLRNASINRGTATESVSFITRPEDQGGTFTIQVSGFSGASSPLPYVLRAATSGGSTALPCATRPSLQSGTPASFPTLPLAPGTQTLFLVDHRRMAAEWGAAEADAIVSKLKTLSADPAVVGAVVPVESDNSVPVDSAYAAWDADPCSSTKANAVVNDINGVVDHVAAGLTNLRNIVIVGGDEVIPQGRVPDLTVEANEDTYADDVAFGGKDNAISRALRDGNVLSDDPYGDFDPQTFHGAKLYVPDVALGRLVESSAQIKAQIDRFSSAKGVLNPQSAAVTGYDFLSDGAQSVFNSLQGAVPSGGAQSAINDTWTVANAQSMFNRASAGFTSINGHADYHRLMPGAAFSGLNPNLIDTTQASPVPGSVLFTMGCHAGLGIPDALVANTTSSALDWAQKFAGANDLYAANSGFGYGDTDTVAWSERLMAGFAANLATKKMTVGQALMFAKQSYAAGTGIADDYDAKAMHEVTFYGLPMFLPASGATSAPAVLPLPTTSAAPRLSSPFNVSPQFTKTHVARGDFWTTSSFAPLTIQAHPIEPRQAINVTATDGVAVHGAIVQGLTSNDTTGVDPAFARPTIDLSKNEPEVQANSAIFPASLANVQRTATPAGLADTLMLSAGQFRSDENATDGTGTQRLYSNISGLVMRSGSDDWAPPVITDVDGFVTPGHLAVFTVNTSSPDSLAGTVLFRTDGDTLWHTASLAKTTSTTLGGATTLPPGATHVTEWTAQVYDGAGNVGSSTNKGKGFVAEPLPNPATGDPAVVLDPTTPAAGYYTSSPQITLDKGDHVHATFQRSIDGGPWTAYTGAFSIPAPGDGGHIVRFRGSDGSTAKTGFAIDALGPTVTGTPTTSPDAFGWYDGAVTVHFTCADSVSGVASCPADQTIATPGENQSVTGTAVDNAGHTGTGGATGISIYQHCNGLAGGGDSITVPAGTHCLLSGTSVKQDVRVLQGATLDCRNATIGHDLTATKPAGIGLRGCHIGHDVSITGISGKGPLNADNYICSTDVAHDLKVTGGLSTASPFVFGDAPDCTGTGAGNSVAHDMDVESNADKVDVRASQVGHDLGVINNTGGTSVSNNTAGHDANCQGNTGQQGSGNKATHQSTCPA